MKTNMFNWFELLFNKTPNVQLTKRLSVEQKNYMISDNSVWRLPWLILFFGFIDINMFSIIAIKYLFSIHNLGRKSGKGCYIYQPGLKTRDVNPEVLEILETFKLAQNAAV